MILSAYNLRTLLFFFSFWRRLVSVRYYRDLPKVREDYWQSLAVLVKVRHRWDDEVMRSR